MYQIILLIYLAAIKNVSGANDIFLPSSVLSEDIKSITKCVMKIFNVELFSKPTVVFLKNIEERELENFHKFSDEVIKIVDANYLPNVIYNLNYIESNISEVFRKINGTIVTVIYFNDCPSLKNFKIDLVKTNVKYLIILRDILTSTICKDVMKKIEKDLDIHDVTFMVQDEVSDIKKHVFFTFMPQIDRNTCKFVHDIEPLKINTCVNSNLAEEQTVFPIKNPLNFNKCPLKVGFGAIYPYTIVKNNTAISIYDPVEEINGSDLEILKVVADYFNTTLKKYYVYKEGENPYDDTDFLKYLINATLDICAGGLYRVYGDVVDYSGVYTRQTIFWSYSAERAPKTWQALMKKINGLYVFVIFYFCYNFVWYLFCIFDKTYVSFKKTLIDAWGALLGATALEDAKSLKQKILNIAYLIICIHLSVYISIILFSFFTIQGPPEMFKTNDELMESGRVPYLIPKMKYFVRDPKYLEFANRSKNCNNFIDCEEKSLADNGVTVLLEPLFFVYQMMTAVKDEARILRVTENIITVYHEMIIRKDSTMVKQFQKVIQRLFEAGICEKFYTEAIGLIVVDKAESANKNMIGNSYNCESGCSITWSQTAGAFYVWLIGCGSSFCVFIIEILVKNTVIIQISTMINCALPIDIVTVKPGDISKLKTVKFPVIVPMIPDKEPIIS